MTGSAACADKTCFSSSTERAARFPVNGLLAVGEFVAAKALWNHSELQFSMARPQTIQYKIVGNSQFQLISITR